MNENMACNSTMALARNLQTMLDVTGMSQSEFGRWIGWPSSRVNTVLKGKYDARLTTVEEVAAAFNRHAGVENALTPETLISADFKVPTVFLQLTA